MMNEKYLNQVSLLVKVLPVIAKEKCFALKGGTAINLFYRNMPRLSVDIDLSYLGFEPRGEACKNINAALSNIVQNLKKSGLRANIQGNNIEKKIICSNSKATIKIEPNYIIRGYINKPAIKPVCENAENKFGYAEIQVISKPELYGGKICAALDRQHPRDLFDIKLLLGNNELDDEITKGFVDMLLSHDKPLHETLNPNIKNQHEIFEKQFLGMSDIAFSYNEHIDTLNKLISAIKSKILPYKTQLLDFVSLKNNLNDFEINNLDKLPAVKWKLHNLQKLQTKNPAKFNEQYEKLAGYFEE